MVERGHQTELIGRGVFSRESSWPTTRGHMRCPVVMPYEATDMFCLPVRSTTDAIFRLVTNLFLVQDCGPPRRPGTRGTRAYRLLHVVIPPGSNVAPPAAALAGDTGRHSTLSHLDPAGRFPAFPRNLAFRTDRSAQTLSQATTTGSVTKRFLCIFVQSAHECKTCGEERRYCLPEVKPMRTTRNQFHGKMRSVHLRSRA
jgi:hypothetical protein